MTSDTPRGVALAEGYADVKKMLYKLSHTYSERFGFPYEDFFSQANALYVKAFDTYNPYKGAKFSTWVYFIVSNNLITYGNKEAKHRNRMTNSIQNIEGYMDQFISTSSNFIEVVDEVGHAAREVMEIALQDTKEINRCVEWLAPTKRNYKAGMREHLLDLGWEDLEIKETFEELKECFLPQSRSKALDEVNATRLEIKLLARVGMSANQIKKSIQKFNANDFNETEAVPA